MLIFFLSFCFFFIFSFGLVLTNNILLSLVGVGALFLLYAIFLFSLHFYYLAFTIGIVYLGAIIILFIYVIMLINLLTSNYNTLTLTLSLKKRLKMLSSLCLVISISILSLSSFTFIIYYPLNIQFYEYSHYLTLPKIQNWYQNYYSLLYDYINFNVLYMRLDFALLTVLAAIALFLGLIASIILVHIPSLGKTYYFSNKQYKIIDKRTLNNMFIQTYRDVDYTIYLINSQPK